MFAIGAAMAVAFVTISHLLAPKSRNPNKDQPYECGVVPQADARAPLNVHYYLVAVLFVLFDLEAVFIYPWAVSLRALGTAALWSRCSCSSPSSWSATSTPGRRACSNGNER